MNSFPLYTQLSKKVLVGELQEDKKHLVIDKIKSLSKNEHELIFALIRTHQMNSNDSTFYTLPYGSKNQKNGIKFDFDRFPNELQWILHDFIQLHLHQTC